jgi:hypothetical protein
MVLAAKGAGFSEVSERLVTDWAQLGLLDHPRREPRPKGSGQGAFYQWSENQRELFLLLLRWRQVVRSVGALAEVAVAVWLYRDDEWATLAQVRRALKTWRGRSSRSYERAERDARTIWRAVFGDIQVPEDRRRRFVEALTDLIYRRVADEANVHELVVTLFERVRGHQPRGPFSFDAEGAARWIYVVIAGVERFEQLDDDLWNEARKRLRQLIFVYSREWSRLSQDPQVGWLFEDQTPKPFVANACEILLAELGTLALELEKVGRLAPLTDGEQ